MKEVKPDKRRLMIWVRALRSGKYKQTTGTLKDWRGDCCLGVVSEEYQRWAKRNHEPLLKIAPTKGDDGNVSFTRFDNHSGDLPPKVRRWIGINEQNPWLYFRKDKRWLSAATANDDYKKSFKEIAQAVIDTYIKPIKGIEDLTKGEELI